MYLTPYRSKKRPFSAKVLKLAYKSIRGHYAKKAKTASKLRRYPRLNRMGRYAGRMVRAGKYRIYKKPFSVPKKLPITAKINLIKNVRGFMISRSLLVGRAVAYGVDPGWGNTIFSYAGTGIPFRVKYAVTDINNIPAGTNTDPRTLDKFGAITYLNNILFAPQWPGSRLGPLGDQNVNGGRGQRFGLMANNNNKTYSDLIPYNQAVVPSIDYNTVNDLITIAASDNYNKLIVTNTYIKMTFQNMSQFYEMEVHIFHVYLRQTKYTDSSGNCVDITNSSLLIQNMTTNTDVYKNVDQQQVFFDQVRKGKLPPKMFKVLKHKKLHLGLVNIAVLTTDTNRNPNLKNSNGQAIYSTKFGRKTWYRTGCSQDNESMTEEVLITRPESHIQILAFAIPALNGQLANGDGIIESYVTYKIEKTNTSQFMEH